MSRRTLAIVALAAVALVVALVAFQLRGSGGSAAQGAVNRAAATAGALAAGIPQAGNHFGSATAPVHITEYADFKCPFCAAASRNILPRLIRDEVTAGRVDLTLRPIRLPDGQGGARLGGDTERGVFAAMAAERQNRMLQFAEALFAVQQDEGTAWVTDAVVTRVARAVGLDMPAWTRDYGSGAVTAELYANEQAAARDGLDGTPFFVIRGPRGRVTTSESRDFAAFQAAIRKVR
ncbi:MAG: DsbA family protein [Thermoleophilia bacterium]